LISKDVLQVQIREDLQGKLQWHQGRANNVKLESSFLKYIPHSPPFEGIKRLDEAMKTTHQKLQTVLILER
jgi:hypothetical protein